jgi:hypothetical protein
MMEKSSTRSDGRDDDLISFQPSSSGTNTEFDQNTLQDERDETKEVHRLAASETAHIRFWRLVVVALLLVSGAVLSTFTYIFLRGEEKDDYVDAVRPDCRAHILNCIAHTTTQRLSADASLIVLPICEYCS